MVDEFTSTYVTLERWDSIVAKIDELTKEH